MTINIRLVTSLRLAFIPVFTHNLSTHINNNVQQPRLSHAKYRPIPYEFVCTTVESSVNEKPEKRSKSVVNRISHSKQKYDNFITEMRRHTSESALRSVASSAVGWKILTSWSRPLVASTAMLGWGSNTFIYTNIAAAMTITNAHTNLARATGIWKKIRTITSGPLTLATVERLLIILLLLLDALNIWCCWYIANSNHEIQSILDYYYYSYYCSLRAVSPSSNQAVLGFSRHHKTDSK